MKKLWANLTAALMTLSVFAGCNKGTDDGNITPPSVNTHTCAYTKEVVASEYLKKAPTCTTSALYYYSCECGEKGDDFFAVGEPNGHRGGTATETEQAVCIVCHKPYGELLSPDTPDGPAHTHVYDQQKATAPYQASEATCKEQATYYYSCACGEKDTSRTFAYGDKTDNHTGGTATETEKAVCTVCGQEYGDYAAHSHVYDKQVATDAYQASEATCKEQATYYYSCSCGEKDTSSTFAYGDKTDNHTGGTATETEKAVCTVCGQEYGDYAAHSHVYDKQVATDAYQASEATCKEQATYYYSCSCGEKDTSSAFAYGELAEHDYTKEKRTSKYLASDATCKTPKTYYYCCSECDAVSADKTYEYGNVVSHSYLTEEATVVYLKDTARCNAPATYYYSCEWCGLASTTDYFEYGTASGNHTGGTATETTQAICDICGTPYGETLSHVHTYTKEVVSAEHLKQAATCGAAAQYWKSCTCGTDAEFADATAYFTAGEPTGKHTGGTATTTSKAVCTVCGQSYGDLLLSEITVSSVTSGYTRYDLGTPYANKTEGFGTQFDTCIVEKQNGLTDEEWQLQVNALKEMNLQNVRVRFYPEMYERGNDNNDPYSFDFSSSSVDFNSLEMQHLYQLLDAFEENGVKVDLSWYGCRTTFNSEDGLVDGSWLGGTLGENNSNWMVAPWKTNNPNEEYAESVAECLDYLFNTKGYTCINEYSIFPEPDGLYKLTTESYIAISTSIESRLAQKGLSDKIQFSGPASMDIANEKYNSSASTWGNTASSFDTNYLQKFVSNGSSVFEKITVSAYPFTNATSNAQMLATAKAYVSVCNKYGLSWGIAECGTSTATSNVSNADAETYDRAMFMARFFINLVNGGCTNIKYFVFSDCGYDSTLNELGLFYFRNKNFAAKPVWYTWSLICRYTDIGSEVFPITSADSNVCITALKLPDGSWTYVAANNGETAKKVAIVNGRADRARSMNLYEVKASIAGGSELKVVSAKDTVSTENGVAEFSIPANGVVVLSNKA